MIKILKKKNYFTLIENSAKGENWMFRNFYMEKDGVVIDSLENGKKSCAVFVSNILFLLNDFLHLIKGPHATVVSTERDMKESGWHEIKEVKKGAVLIWEVKDGHLHIGFYMGNDEAVSNSSTDGGFPQKHHYTYNDTRKIEKIYWHPGLDEE